MCMFYMDTDWIFDSNNVSVEIFKNEKNTDKKA